MPFFVKVTLVLALVFAAILVAAMLLKLVLFAAIVAALLIGTLYTYNFARALARRRRSRPEVYVRR